MKQPVLIATACGLAPKASALDHSATLPLLKFFMALELKAATRN